MSKVGLVTRVRMAGVGMSPPVRVGAGTARVAGTLRRHSLGLRDLLRLSWDYPAGFMVFVGLSVEEPCGVGG